MAGVSYSNKLACLSGVISPAIKTAMTREYTAMIPAMTTGISDYVIEHQPCIPVLALPCPVPSLSDLV